MKQRQAIRQVIVSLHDVAPPFEDAIRKQLDLLAASGVRRVVLKVTPNWHGAHSLDDAPSLVELLRAQVAAGSQLVLHGYEHWSRPGRSFHGPWLMRVRARLFAADAAEFLTLAPDEAEAALRRGLDCFARLDLPRPTMFCPPGWLSDPAIETALRRVGIRYLVGMFSVRDVRSSWRLWTPGVGYMGASAGQETGVQILNGIVRHTALRASSVTSVAKVYLHPQHDPTGALVRRRLAELERMLGQDGWQLATYADVCGADA